MTHEILHAAISIVDPRQRWVISRQPPLNPAFAIAEIIWIITGRSDSAFLTYWNPGLPHFAGEGATFHGAYGYRLRHHFQLDQLNRAYEVLLKNPDSRQVMLQIWDSFIDLPDQEGKPVSADVPCNVASLLKVREGRLEWSQIMRSNDVFLGLPYNFVQFTSLQEIIAGWLDLRVGSYNHISDSLHVYERDFKNLAETQPGITGVNDDSLALPKAESDKVFTELASRVETMIANDLSQRDLYKTSSWKTGPHSYQNMLLLLGAEAGRRRGWPTLAQEIMTGCTNPMLKTLWKRWYARTSKRPQFAEQNADLVLG